MNKRIIKNESFSSRNVEINQVPVNNQLLHPISSIWVQNKSTNPFCLTKFHLDKKNNLNILNEYTCKTNVNNYKKYMYLPPIGFSSSDILQIYEISSIDDLSRWISDNIENKNYITINRVLNCWIKNNFDTLKNYNNFLEKIYNKLIQHYFLKGQIKKFSESEINKEIKDFIDYWTNKYSGSEFNLDLLEELLIYIKKKYN